MKNENGLFLDFPDAVSIAEELNKECSKAMVADVSSARGIGATTILCGDKVRAGKENDNCAVINGSDCPEGISPEILGRFR